MDEALEKLRFGVYVMIREGFVRRELGELSKLKDVDVDRRRLILVSDTFDAVMLCEEGYLDSVVRRAIEYGFNPIEAIKMATINPADYYGLRHLGAIAPSSPCGYTVSRRPRGRFNRARDGERRNGRDGQGIHGADKTL